MYKCVSIYLDGHSGYIWMNMFTITSLGSFHVLYTCPKPDLIHWQRVKSVIKPPLYPQATTTGSQKIFCKKFQFVKGFSLKLHCKFKLQKLFNFDWLTFFGLWGTFLTFRLTQRERGKKSCYYTNLHLATLVS